MRFLERPRSEVHAVLLHLLVTVAVGLFLAVPIVALLVRWAHLVGRITGSW